MENECVACGRIQGFTRCEICQLQFCAGCITPFRQEMKVQVIAALNAELVLSTSETETEQINAQIAIAQTW